VEIEIEIGEDNENNSWRKVLENNGQTIN